MFPDSRSEVKETNSNSKVKLSHEVCLLVQLEIINPMMKRKREPAVETTITISDSEDDHEDDQDQVKD